MNHADARMRMVENQLRANKVTDPLVVAAMSELPREAFAPEAMKDFAYVDEALPIGGGRHLMEPMVLARLLEASRVQPEDVVLLIGCGAGYAAAVLARLATTVVALESDAAMAAKATAILGELGLDNVAVIEGPLKDGYGKQAPYNVIFVNGAIDEIPAAVTAQLADGGRLVAVLAGDAQGRGVLVSRSGEKVSHRELFDAGTPALSEFTHESGFAL